VITSQVRRGDVAELVDLAAGEVRERLQQRLRERWPEAQVSRVWRAEGGFSNETWFVELAINDDRQVVVLRRQALVGPLEPYDLVREAAILRGLAATEVPVPAVELLCEDPDVLGSPFVVLERIEGEVPEYRDLPEYPAWADPRHRTAMARELLVTLARIQRAPVHDGPLVAALADPSAAADPSRPVLARVRRVMAKLESDIGAAAVPPVLRVAAGWLIDHAPATSETVLVHGDFKVGNFIWREGKIVSVLDWELTSIGDPLEDLGYACHPVMRARRPDLMAMLVPFDELRQLYAQELGVELDIARLHYYMIYALYFHLYTFVTGLVAALRGADIRVALGYAKFPLGARELLAHMAAFEEGRHAL
jgi:aminoglycoside phosphotransferase (APT) family kinase protein